MGESDNFLFQYDSAASSFTSAISAESASSDSLAVVCGDRDRGGIVVGGVCSNSMYKKSSYCCLLIKSKTVRTEHLIRTSPGFLKTRNFCKPLYICVHLCTPTPLSLQKYVIGHPIMLLPQTFYTKGFVASPGARAVVSPGTCDVGSHGAYVVASPEACYASLVALCFS